ncbi:pimeloyl-ACP methyl ester carboxylesterase [Nocardia transvalensis]|uniref:Pimeloyl-ACP methyl ester carboxylesterase n=1 Tax=Nocardia transvalensis TaxID=37333 RepID=A0A7W9UKJ5_9NOCA|nr:alpha/beta hydrolase family protein [Nocardia transvalensis]MBB5916549.1 pimeloyl-ACP methyl ester carboxylesterase [Nocardia transvalensis]
MAALFSFATGVVQAEETPAPDSCRSFFVPVPQGQLAATLCLPSDAPANTVMVLMSGSNYNGTYWDFSYQPETYNFRKAMNRAGYATLIVDRLGNGASTRPPALSLTASATADALHGIVQGLRQGLAGAQPFGKVVTVGHSLTSGTSVMEASAHHDVDGVVLTGYSHALNVGETLGVVATYQPAGNDPAFAGRGYDSGYLVSRPGARMHDFYAPDNVDPEVLALDEKTKEAFSLTEYPDGLLSTLPGMSSLINAPVLVVDGSLDRLSCGINYTVCANSGTLQAAEAPYFSPAARLRTFVLPGSGHALNLARNTVEYQSAVIDWANSTVGR